MLRRLHSLPWLSLDVICPVAALKAVKHKCGRFQELWDAPWHAAWLYPVAGYDVYALCNAGGRAGATALWVEEERAEPELLLRRSRKLHLQPERPRISGAKLLERQAVDCIHASERSGIQRRAGIYYATADIRVQLESCTDCRLNALCARRSQPIHNVAKASFGRVAFKVDRVSRGSFEGRAALCHAFLYHS